MKAFILFALALTGLFIYLEIDAANAKPACTCPAPTDLAVDGTTLCWTGQSGADSYEAKAIHQGNFTEYQGNVSGTCATWTGIPSGTYKVYVRSKCGLTYSSWIIGSEDMVVL